MQARMDAPGDIRVRLDSSTPCWNDANSSFYFNLNIVSPGVSIKEGTKIAKVGRRLIILLPNVVSFVPS